MNIRKDKEFTNDYIIILQIFLIVEELEEVKTD